MYRNCISLFNADYEPAIANTSWYCKLWDRDDVIFNTSVSEKWFTWWWQSTNKLYPSLGRCDVVINRVYFSVSTRWSRKEVRLMARGEEWATPMTFRIDFSRWVFGFDHQSGLCKQWRTGPAPRLGHPAWNENVFVLFQITCNVE